MEGYNDNLDSLRNNLDNIWQGLSEFAQPPDTGYQVIFEEDGVWHKDRSAPLQNPQAIFTGYNMCKDIAFGLYTSLPNVLSIQNPQILQIKCKAFMEEKEPKDDFNINHWLYTFEISDKRYSLDLSYSQVNSYYKTLLIPYEDLNKYYILESNDSIKVLSDMEIGAVLAYGSLNEGLIRYIKNSLHQESK